MKKVFTRSVAALALGASIALAFSGCGSQTPAKQDTTEKIKVVASFDAMKEITQAIGGNKVDVTTIIPEGIEPHDYELKTSDVQKLQEAKLFVYNGLGMEAWADKAIQTASADNLMSVALAEHVQPIELTDPEEIEEHGAYDPHAWLGLTSAKEEASAVKDALIKISPEDKEYFEKNYMAFADEIDKMQEEYMKKVANATRKEIVTGHAAFGYLCRDLGISQESVEDVFASGEPSAQKLAELTDFCKAHNVKVIFTEDLVSPAVSETLAKEAGAKAEAIHTIESAEDGMTYLARMKDNLNKIAEALM
ncbi:metal ABC transporter solute-binding protein, Zn/Mn family [Dialister pneumosintes]|uniref:ABC transporter substrate-binding protein n=1 Tax=Dialister pneumosintes TaxID=39950 RepID=A0A1B3WED9_9FIRM|nr:zinc ABC transporter substrate-binding protein [Dialister pneumosintes]AOH39334.1 ABC transporter substrate-binding protein [Dialister pneumosintes]RID94771.1 ABC transporter substrate-binding protein [Dialister pneumosintes]